MLSYPQANIVKKVEEQTVGQNGGLFDNNILAKPEKDDKKNYFQLKITFYNFIWGYARATIAYSILIVSEFGKNKELKFLGLPLLDKVKYEKNPVHI